MNASCLVSCFCSYLLTSYTLSHSLYTLLLPYHAPLHLRTVTPQQHTTSCFHSINIWHPNNLFNIFSFFIIMILCTSPSFQSRGSIIRRRLVSLFQTTQPIQRSPALAISLILFPIFLFPGSGVTNRRSCWCYSLFSRQILTLKFAIQTSRFDCFDSLLKDRNSHGLYAFLTAF